MNRVRAHALALAAVALLLTPVNLALDFAAGWGMEGDTGVPLTNGQWTFLAAYMLCVCTAAVFAAAAAISVLVVRTDKSLRTFRATTACVVGAQIGLALLLVF